VKLLVTTGHPDMARYAHPNLGRLVQPRHYSSIEQTAHAGIPWAADNDAFKAFDAEAFERMLHRLRGLPGCLFVAAPDVVGDAEQTDRLFGEWRSGMVGLPIALFIGGDDTFKLGPDGERMAAAARDRGKWLHVGRVNGMRRLRYCATIGADSVDGSSWARWKATWLRDGLAGVGQPRQPRLGEADRHRRPR
jgi:hypothetical protein